MRQTGTRGLAMCMGLREGGQGKREARRSKKSEERDECSPPKHTGKKIPKEHRRYGGKLVHAKCHGGGSVQPQSEKKVKELNQGDEGWRDKVEKSFIYMGGGGRKKIRKKNVIATYQKKV